MILGMIRSVNDPRVLVLRQGKTPKRFPSDIATRAQRTLAQLDAAVVLDDMRAPPGNRLEPLSGDRAGQHSVRINDQWRVCFVWKDDGAHDVEIVDYH